MKVLMTFEGETIETEVGEEFRNLFNNKKTGFERVKHGESYWFINYTGIPEESTEYNDLFENELFEKANYFSDVNFANDMGRVETLRRKIHRRSVELCAFADLAKRTKCAWAIGWDASSERIVASPVINAHFGNVLFDTENHCMQVIDEFYDELIWYFAQFKGRANA